MQSYAKSKFFEHKGKYFQSYENIISKFFKNYLPQIVHCSKNDLVWNFLEVYNLWKQQKTLSRCEYKLNFIENCHYWKFIFQKLAFQWYVEAQSKTWLSVRWYHEDLGLLKSKD